MPRINQLQELLFPVVERPVFVTLPTDGRDLRLQAPDQKALVNAATRRVLGVVSREYRLVRNQEALEWGLRCCREVFPDTHSGEWVATAADGPSTGGHCHIDLTHNSAALDFAFVAPNNRPEAFGPFIRVTNSYNRLRALAFDVGFFRKVCKNGLILPQSVIRFRFNHMRRDIKAISFVVADPGLSRLRTSFDQCLGSLRNCHVARPDFEALVHAVLQLRVPEPLAANSKEAADWEALQRHISALCDRYATHLGQNGYAVLNAVTEFASQPPGNRCVRRDRHGLQRLAGSWVGTFSQKCGQPGFNIAPYLNDASTAGVPK